MNSMKTAIAMAIGLALCAVAAPANAQKKTKPAGNKDPQVEAQLRINFGRMDLNKDDFLDPAELAKWFRGPKAKAPKPLEYDDTGNPKAGTGLNRNYQDQVFLYALDKDSDGRISWPEFEVYGQKYIAQFKAKQLSMQHQQALYLQAQRNMAASQRRRTTYSRNNRSTTHYRTVRHTAYRRPTYHASGNNTAQIYQAQQRQYNAMIQQQQRYRMAMMQQMQAAAQRQRAVYVRQMEAAYRQLRTRYARRR